MREKMPVWNGGRKNKRRRVMEDRIFNENVFTTYYYEDTLHCHKSFNLIGDASSPANPPNMYIVSS